VAGDEYTAIEFPTETKEVGVIYFAGTTSASIDILICDDSGLAVAGLVAATFPTLTYSLAGPNADVAFPSLSDLAAITTAYASGGVKERGNGYYRADLPNGALANGGVVCVRGEASGKHVICERIHVVAYNPQDAVRLGLTSLPNATAGAIGGLPTTGLRSNTAQAGAGSTITLDAGAAATDNFYQDAVIVLTGGTGAGQSRAIQSYVGSTKVATIFPAWTTNPDATSTFTLIPFGQVDVGNWLNGTIPSVNVAGVPLVDLKYILGTLSPAAAGYIGPDWGHVNAPTTTLALTGTTVGTITTYTGNTLQTGDSYARLGAPAGASVSADILTKQATLTTSTGVTFPSSVASPTNITAGTITTVTNLTNAATAGDLTAAMKTSVTTAATAATPTVAAVTGAVGSVTGNIGGNVVGSVGSIAGITFPTNFAALGISAGGKISEVTLVDTLTTYTGNTVQTGDSFARLGVAGVGLTNLGDTRIANLDAAVSTRTKPADTLARVTLVDTVTTNTDMRGTNSAALAATALTTAEWTNALAAALTTLAGHDPGTTLGTSTYGGADTAGTTTLLGYIGGNVALASQIPANFTSALFASAGVFATAALANAPVTAAGPSAATIATTILQDLTSSSDFNTAGSFGALVKANLNAPVGSIPTNPYTGTPPSAVQIRQEIDTNSAGLAAIYARTDVATSTRAIQTGSAPSWYASPVDVSASVATLLTRVPGVVQPQTGDAYGYLTTSLTERYP
jgi:hypothetical protein